jgi:hypothetical protein
MEEISSYRNPRLVGISCTRAATVRLRSPLDPILDERNRLWLLLKVATLTKSLSVPAVAGFLRRILHITRRVVAQKPCKAYE